MKSLNLKEIVMELIGPISPVGSSGSDEKRLENLKELTHLIEELIYEVRSIQHNSERPEMSMQLIGRHAKQFMEEMRE